MADQQNEAPDERLIQQHWGQGRLERVDPDLHGWRRGADAQRCRKDAAVLERAILPPGLWCAFHAEAGVWFGYGDVRTVAPCDRTGHEERGVWKKSFRSGPTYGGVVAAIPLVAAAGDRAPLVADCGVLLPQDWKTAGFR